MVSGSLFGAFPKLRKATTSYSGLSVCLSVLMAQLGCYWTDLIEILRKSVKKVKGFFKIWQD
jgi:hypothetical protein